VQGTPQFDGLINKLTQLTYGVWKAKVIAPGVAKKLCE
jgi:hypothetical protein